MNRDALTNDIPTSAARAAHSGTSFDPERRAEQEREGYAALLFNDWEALSKLATTPGKLSTLEAEFARYRAGFRQRKLRQLASRARCLSSMITGPSNFPTRRNEKRNDIERRRSVELEEFRARALKAIRRALCPELAPIMAGDSDAVTRLAQKIAHEEAIHARALEINKAHKRFLKDPASLDASTLDDSAKERIRRYVPAYSWEPHPVAPYEFTNRTANIRRMKERLASISSAQATPASEQASENGNGVRLEDSPADNRVRLYFPGKPAPDVRAGLKAKGFRWTPTLGCWQAYRNTWSLAHAQTFVSQPAPEPAEAKASEQERQEQHDAGRQRRADHEAGVVL